jgi:hypothetical protein
MTLQAATRDQAVGMFKAGMTQEALDAHMREYHKPDEQRPTLQQAHMMIEQTVAAA